MINLSDNEKISAAVRWLKGKGLKGMAPPKGMSLSDVKVQNIRQIKRVIYYNAPVSRQRITDELGLTLPSITTAVSAMLADGTLEELLPARHTASAGGGRQVHLLDFRSNAYYAVGVEVGPYRTTLAITDLRGHVRCEEIIPVAPADYGAMLDYLCSAIDRLVRRSELEPARIYGIGVGFPGFIDNKTGITRSANRRQWIHKPLMQDLHDRLTLPVWADNNARMRAVGREMFSSSRAPGTFAYFFVSKGLACPLMIENLLYSGHRASAGEIGHNVILPGGPVCPTCGKRGCLEAVSSESAILLAAAQAAGERKSAMLAQMLADHGELSTELLLEAQRQGDAAVCDILRSAVAYLGMEIANIFNFISPSLITVDGLIFENQVNRDGLMRAVHQNLFGLTPDEAKVEFLPFNKMSGAYGAAAFVVRNCLLG